MTRRTDELGPELDKLAINLAKEAQTEGVSVGDRLDIMKIVGTYWAARNRVVKKKPDDDEEADVPDFESIRSKIHAVEKEVA